jgi:hypothetical protein
LRKNRPWTSSLSEAPLLSIFRLFLVSPSTLVDSSTVKYNDNIYFCTHQILGNDRTLCDSEWRGSFFMMELVNLSCSASARLSSLCYLFLVSSPPWMS